MNEKVAERREILEQKSVVLERQSEAVTALYSTYSMMLAAQIGREGWDVAGNVHDGENEG